MPGFRLLTHHVGKVLTVSTLIGITGGSLVLLQKNEWNISTLGLLRFGRAAKSVAVCVADYKWNLRGLDPKTDKYWKVKSQVGQHLGALEYLLPVEYVETMKVLHSDAPQSPKEDLFKVIKEDLGKDVDEIFTNFEDKPLGAASLAQVHKAKLKDTGTVVAVKVQHPRVKAHSVVDMATMELLVHLVSWIFPEFNLIWLAEETKKNFPIELDFYNEAKNCERMKELLSYCDYLKIPKVYWDFTTNRVLTMEYCEGAQVNDVEYIKDNNISVNEISEKLGELYSEMIFVHGYVHCDPHPGNVLVKNTPKGVQLVLLDHGLYQTLTDEFRLDYCKLWKAIIGTDMDRIKKYSERIGIGRLYPLFACMVTARSWSAISKGVDKLEFTKSEEEEIQNNVSSYLSEISEILNTVPRQMLLIFKTNDLLRGIETHLKTRAMASSFITMSRACLRSIFSHKRNKCQTWLCRLHTTIVEQYYLFMLSAYKLYLWFRETPLGHHLTWTQDATVIEFKLNSS
ncbi:hypothetical protein LSH36_427g03001 [Paralvinella palmiformis]|uniref:Protein kinase domain-containing protein n=1 Tax=Paralvinella palmiformis TaxID=53620 RepID=A0AAD9JC61_9ANNE|nr:hypothetical protein LSH36_427g03001 [Paralvinella palmiformis]